MSFNSGCQSAHRLWIKRKWIFAARAIFVTILVIIAVFASHKAATPAQLVGTYHCTYQYGAETLILSANDSYSQVFTFRSGRVIKNSGIWGLNINSELVLHDAIVVDTGFGTPKTAFDRGIWIMPVKRTLGGQLFFTVNEDLGLNFQ